MAYIENEEIPVFIINGFLEAGKTRFLRFTLDQDYFKTEGETILLNCEEGDEQYPQELLESTNTRLLQIGDISELTTEKLKAIETAYDPERIIIEWNGMWQMSDFRLPDGWFLNQQITVIDTGSFDLYLKNMKPLLGQMLKFSEMVICNRADGVDEEVLGSYYLQLKAMTKDAEIIFEGKDGEIRGDFNIELPYDINADSIVVDNKDFAIFYVDMMDRPERYSGKHVEYVGEILAPEELGDSAFVVGRMVMTCCEADIQYLGIICRYGKASAYNNRDWIKVRGVVRAEENEQYGGVGPVIYVDEVVRTARIDEVAGL